MKFSNYLKADFYKLKRSNWIWIMPLILFGVVLLLYVLLFILMKLYETGEVEPDPTNTLILEASALGRSLLFTAPSESNLTILLMVACAIFVSSEFKSGMTKIRLSRGANKVGLYFSKFIMLSGVTVVYTIGTFILSAILSLCFFNLNGFTALEFGYLIRSIVLSIYINLSIISIYMMLAYLVRNMGGTIGACIGTYVVGSLFSTVAALFQEGTPVAEIFNCVPSRLLTFAGFAGEYDLAKTLELIFVPLFFIVVCNIVSIFTFKNRDVK